MIRVILALCVSVWISAAAAEAELVYTTVMSGAEELRGWWDCQTRVLYLESGACRWVKAPTSVARCAAPAGAVAPARRVFQRVPDLPYGLTKATNGQSMVGWLHAASGTLFVANEVFSARSYGLGNIDLVDERKAPCPMPADAREFLDQWAIEHSAEPDGGAVKPPRP